MPYHTLISIPQFKDIHGQDNLCILDARFRLNETEAGRVMYAEGHIPGAQYVHLDDDLSGPVVPGQTGRHPIPKAEKLIALWSQLGIDEDVQVVIYDDMGGAIAARAWWLLRWMGHEKAAVLDGGWQAWVSTGGALEQVEPKVAPRNFQPKWQKDWLLDAESVETIRMDSNWKLIDSRTAERYRGETEPIDPVAGHIPGAVNAPHPHTVGNDGLFKSALSLAEQFKAVVGSTPDTQTVFYCGSGVTACRNILAYAVAGLGQARLYGGSWSDWIAKGDRPVANDL